MNKKGNDPTHISFRITNAAVADELAARAQAAGVSPNLLARELLTEALCRSDRMSQQLYQVEADIAEIALRLADLGTIEQHLLRGIHLLLKYAGKLDAPQAKQAMQKFFLGETPAGEPHAVDQKNGAGE